MGEQGAASRGVAERLLRRDRTLLGVFLTTLFALAGLYTVLGAGMDMSALEMTAMQGMRDMPGPRTLGQWSAGFWLLVFVMWWVMMVAMMLPSVSPTVLLHSALLRQSRTAQTVPAISLAFLSGYLLAWAGFSAMATIAQWSLEKAGSVSASMMTLTDSALGALVLIGAGIYQFTPLKATCIQHCRAPAEFITRRRRRGIKGAVAMGVEHGIFCLGCCWFLMALLFVGGIMNLYWIVGLTAFVAIEKLAPSGEALGRIAGAALVLWGGYILAGAVLV